LGDVLLGSWDDEDMKVISDLKAAKDAMTLIIEQGEGSKDEEKGSHYKTFQQLFNEDELATYPVPENPKTKAYEGFDIHTVRGPVIPLDISLLNKRRFFKPADVRPWLHPTLL
jgi:hypothetical protein